MRLLIVCSFIITLNACTQQKETLSETKIDSVQTLQIASTQTSQEILSDPIQPQNDSQKRKSILAAFSGSELLE
jgi:hypothetical protein